MNETNISNQTARKIQLYTAAVFLFDKGKSHPQVVELLSEFEPNTELLVMIVDNAMHEKWDKLFIQANELFSLGMTYNEVLLKVIESEPDKEVAKFICEFWYEWKTKYMECLVEAPNNIFEGMKGIIFCSIGTVIIFLVNLGWIAKALWITALILSIIQWTVGIQQRRLSKQINELFSIDILDSENTTREEQ